MLYYENKLLKVPNCLSILLFSTSTSVVTPIAIRGRCMVVLIQVFTKFEKNIAQPGVVVWWVKLLSAMQASHLSTVCVPAASVQIQFLADGLKTAEHGSHTWASSTCEKDAAGVAGCRLAHQLFFQSLTLIFK